MNADDIKPGRVYEARKPKRTGFRGLLNDRAVRWIDSARTKVQYDGPAVAYGKRLPVISMSKFLQWAEKDVTALMPVGAWREFLSFRK